MPFFVGGLREAGFFLGAVLAVAGFRAAAVFDLAVAVVLLAVCGDFAELVRFAVDVRLAAVPLLLPDLELPVVVRFRPDVVDLDRADVVERDAEDVLRLPPVDDADFDRLPDERELLGAVFPPLLPAAAFFVELLLEVERPPVVFFDEAPKDFFDELLAERLRLVAAAPFLPAALFLADVDERVPLVDFLVADAAFFVVEDREPEAEVFFLAPPEDERAELELFFEPPLLLEPDEEREPVDLLVVAMRIIPPKKWCVSAWPTFSKMCALIIVLS